MKPIVFLGGGRITSALLTGLRRSGYGDKLVVHDRHGAKLRRLQRELGVTGEPDLRRAVAAAGLLVVAVRPGSVAKLLSEIAPLRRSLTAVSLAAGIPISALRVRLGPPLRWARAMPSPVCRTGHGLTALSFDRGVPAGTRAQIRRLFAQVGEVVEIPDRQFDAFTVAYSPSHAYHALAALAEAAEEIGLDRRTALLAAAHALGDGVQSWRQSGVALPRLIHEAATPGGTAAAVMAAMDRAGYRRVIERGLRIGLARARAAGRKLEG